MKTSTRSTPTLLKPPAPAPVQLHQLSIAFEESALHGLLADQQAQAVRALALMLLQAAGVRLTEGDDVEC